MSDDDSAFGIVPRYLRGTLTANEIAVYVALTWRADNTGACWPSHATLAADAGMSVSVVQRTLKSLHSKGIVSWAPRMKDGGGQTSNGYRVAVWGAPERSVDMTDPVGRYDRGGRSNRPGGSVDMTDEQDTLNETQGTKTSARAARGVPEGFAEFYLAYPRKVGRADAEKAWAKAVKATGDPQRIIAAASRFAEIFKASGKEKEFCPHPSTWLNKGRYEDEELQPQPDRPAGQGPSGQAPWCGDCDEFSRLVYPEGRMSSLAAPCPTCHPISVRKAANR